MCIRLSFNRNGRLGRMEGHVHAILFHEKLLVRVYVGTELFSPAERQTDSPTFSTIIQNITICEIFMHQKLRNLCTQNSDPWKCFTFKQSPTLRGTQLLFFFFFFL